MSLKEYTAPSCADLTQRFEQLSDFGKNVLCQIAIKLIVEEEIYIKCKKGSSNIVMLNFNREETT